MIGDTNRAELVNRLTRPEQVAPDESLSNLPSYIDAFLAHLRLLVGVPFHYLVPDARLLPPESIRFFYLDRSWTDRVVDGTLAVGQIGTREMAHVQHHAPGVQVSLDDSESLVRDLQRGKITDYSAEKKRSDRPRVDADVITGFLLRSALVAGWPQMEVRGFTNNTRLITLRLERLSSSVMIALWRGVPDRVELEEPHHGVQFAVDPAGPAGFSVFLRHADGHQIMDGVTPVSVPVPMRKGGHNVVHVSELRNRLEAAHTKPPPAAADAIHQTGSAAFAISVLNPPWLQQFSNAVPAPTRPVVVGTRLDDSAFVSRLRVYVGGGNG